MVNYFQRRDTRRSSNTPINQDNCKKRLEIDLEYTCPGDESTLKTHRSHDLIQDPTVALAMAPIAIAVLSGKGGVGKSTLSAQLALFLALSGLSVGILDIDLTGPSIPRLLGHPSATITQSHNGWIPVPICKNLVCMSIAFLLQHPDQAIVWRGPKKSAMIRSFIQQVAWPASLDVLVIDTPPGTSDEHLGIVEYVKVWTGSIHAVVVTTPQQVALSDAIKMLDFCSRMDIHVLGVVENMSGWTCPHCGEISHVLGKGGAQQLAKLKQVAFLGDIPLTKHISLPIQLVASDNSAVNQYEDIPGANLFLSVLHRIMETLPLIPKR